VTTPVHYPSPFWAWRPEQRSQSNRSLLGKDSVNTFLRQQILKQQLKYLWTITMETVFSVGSDPKLYNKDPRPPRINNWDSLLKRQSEMIGKSWQRVSCVARVRLREEGFMCTALTVRLI
jgi:hypothetical protein